ncbi:MAG: hypothetical protein Q4D79_02490 [Propionibacteriaceae bacterium]|nr:hypothetical protein [Propionibacteriaceae bacterium]
MSPPAALTETTTIPKIDDATTSIPRIDETTTIPKITASLLKSRMEGKTGKQNEAKTGKSKKSETRPTSKESQSKPTPDPADDDTPAAEGKPAASSRRKGRARPRRSADSPNEPEWRKVDTEEDDEPDDKPPLPLAVKIGGILLIGVVLVVAGWLGLSIGGSGPPDHSNLWAVKPPIQIGDFVAKDVKDTSPADRSRSVSTANYSDGTSKFVLVVSRYEVSMPGIVENTGLANPVKVGNATCGTTVDTNLPACVRIVDFTGVLVAGLSGQDPETLVTTLDSVTTALTGS